MWLEDIQEIKRFIYLQLNEPQCNPSLGRNPLLQDLQNAWAVVTYNSSPGVVSLIEGIPVFAMDPDPTIVHHVANTTLKRLEDPKMFDLPRMDRGSGNEPIEVWMNFPNGEAWEFMRNYVRPHLHYGC